MSGIFGGGDDSGKYAEEGARRGNEAYQRYADEGINFNKEQHEKNRADVEKYYGIGQDYLNPYLKAGGSALDAYLGGLGLSGDAAQQSILEKFQNLPGYQFMYDEGLKAVNRSAAARGTTQSGGLLKELTQYGQGIANQEFGTYLDRLGQLAGMGQQTAGQASGNAMNTGGSLAGLGENLANRYTNIKIGQGESAANAEIAAGQARAEAERNKRNWLDSVIGGAAKGAGAYFGGK
jgi:hypothetical protein